MKIPIARRECLPFSRHSNCSPGCVKDLLRARRVRKSGIKVVLRSSNSRVTKALCYPDLGSVALCGRWSLPGGITVQTSLGDEYICIYVYVYVDIYIYIYICMFQCLPCFAAKPYRNFASMPAFAELQRIP